MLLAGSVVPSKVTLKILDNKASLTEKLIVELAPKILKMFNDSIPEIQRFVKSHIKGVIKSNFDFNSMISGELRAELGFSNGRVIVDAIVRELIEEIEVKIDDSTITKNGIDITFGVRFVDLSFYRILGMPEAEYLSSNSRGERTTVKWADWLLTKGNSIVVKHFYIDYSLTVEEEKRSRSRLALMKPSRSQNYRIPLGFSGTVNNNIVTRAFENSEQIIIKEIETILMKRAK